MIDINELRNEIDGVDLRLRSRGFVFDKELFVELEKQRKAHQINAQDLQEKRNDISKKIGIEKSNGNNAEKLMTDVAQINESLKNQNNALYSIQNKIQDYLLNVPNLPHKSVPHGLSEASNMVVKEVGDKKIFDFEVKDHVDLGQRLGLDFDMGSKLSGSRFAVIRSKLALLHRALGQFMLDTHVNEHGYQEVYVPFLVNEDALKGTGQLPKFGDDLFRVDLERPLYLIPTAEVPVTNLYRDQILAMNDFPIKMVCHTPCFRSEAGSYGRDTRGMIRQHQFEKVELVQLVPPQESQAAHEALTLHAEAILQKLELPYRVMNLCGGDLGASSSKTYDLEVWLPGQNQYREISSCSNFKDFQARRLQARYRIEANAKPELVHTINGSGLAVGRTLVAVLENFQDDQGQVTVPDALRPYLGGKTKLLAQ